MQFPAFTQQRGERTLKLRFVVANLSGSQATSASAIPEGYTKCTAAKTATGVFVINFATAFSRKPVVMAIPFHASQKNFATIAANSTTSVTVNTWNDTGAAADPTELYVTVDGFDVLDQI